MVFETGNALLSIELSDPTNFSQIQSKILMTHIIDVKTETVKNKIHFCAIFIVYDALRVEKQF